MNSLSKLIFGMNNNITLVANFLENSEKQAISYLRGFTHKIQDKVVLICYRIFEEIINDKLTIEHLKNYESKENKNEKINEFLLFLILNQKDIFDKRFNHITKAFQ